MNAVFSKELIFERIKDSGYPFWSLGLCQGFKNTANVMQYYGNDFEEADTPETMLQKSIKRLDNVVSSFPPDSVFVIEILNGKNANGSGRLGPFQFSAAPSVPQNNQQSLQGVPEGYLPQSMLKGIEENMQRQFDARFEQLKAETERRQREAEFHRREMELEEREKQLKELEKGYKSDVAKTADVLLAAGKAIVKYLIPGLQESAAAAPSALQGVDNEEQPQDAKSKVIDDFAEYLYNNYDEKAIAQLHHNLINIQKNANTNVEKKSTDDNNTTANS